MYSWFLITESRAMNFKVCAHYQNDNQQIPSVCGLRVSILFARCLRKNVRVMKTIS